MKKPILKRTADIFEKIGVAGIAVALFQGKTTGIFLSFILLFASYIFTIWESKQ